MITLAKVVKTSVTTAKNSPSWDYSHLDHYTVRVVIKYLVSTVLKKKKVAVEKQ